MAPDRLGGVFMALAGAVAAVTAVYGIGYATGPAASRSGWAAFAVFILGMQLVPAASDVVSFLVACEVQQLLAQRSRAEQVPDPTVGLRYSNEMGGNEKVAGVYLTVPISFGQRNASAQIVEQQAQIAADQSAFVERRLHSDIDAAYQQAVRSYATYLQAREAGEAIRSNAELIAKAYRLGEGSLADSLSARRIAQEATLSENLAQLNANESRYRLELDAHQLWSREEANHEPRDSIGSVAASLTTLSFVPQVWQVWKTRQAQAISLGMYSLFTLGVALWLVYGILLVSWPIIIANSITVILAGAVLVMKLKFG